MTPGRLLEIAEQHPPELDITDLAKAIARKALAALLDKATATGEYASGYELGIADEATREILARMPALLAHVLELESLVESLVERMARSDSNVAIAMRERCAQACEELSLHYDGQESEASSRVYADLCRGSRNGADACAAAIRALEL